MAGRLMYPIGSFKYGNRMLRAGDDPVMMPGPDQRLYSALGKVKPTPLATGGRVETAPAVVGEQPSEQVVVKTQSRAPRKPATRKRAAKKTK